jgi:hypothetical protein
MMQNQPVRNQNNRTSRPINPQNRAVRPQQQQQQKPKPKQPRQKQMAWRPVSDKPVQTKFTNRNVKRSNLSSNFGTTSDTKRLPQFTEQVSQPLSSVAWALFKSYSLNPGQVTQFPVGSVETQQWQKYRFRNFRVIYEPIVNEYNTNNDGAGEIIIGFDPDASDQAPTTYSQAVNMKPIARGRPCDKIVLVVPQFLLKGQNDAHFVRHAGLPGGSDIKTYDVGLINISVVGSGTTGSTVLGNIFFEYELDLVCQQITLNTQAPVNNQVSFFQSTTAQTVPSGVKTTLLNATASANGLGIVNTAGSFVPPIGNYLVDFTAQCSITSGNTNTILIDFQKNGTSVFNAGNVPELVEPALGAAIVSPISGTCFVSANGTDAFTNTCTWTNATGSQTVGSVVRWTAV